MGVNENYVGKLSLLFKLFFRLYLCIRCFILCHFLTISQCSFQERSKKICNLTCLDHLINRSLLIWPLPNFRIPKVRFLFIILNYFHSDLGIMIAGICLLGVSVSLIFVPLLSEIIESVQEKEGLGENPALNDKASAVFNSAYATGCIVGPVIGGFLNDAVGFRSTCDYMGFASCSFAAIFFFFNILPNCFTKNKKKT